MPAIVIAAHARPVATQRLLDSIDRADVPADTNLVISIDMPAALGASADKAALGQQVHQIADEFVWRYGAKSVVVHEQVGLVDHFHRCGDLTAEHDGIVLLEDDLLVGRGFYRWATAALEYGDSDRRIAGVGLVTPWFDGYRRLRFEPVDDGSDGIYLQVPWYDGMAWTARMWDDYRQASVDDSIGLHAAFDDLDEDEWFPHYMRYLVQSERTFLLPRAAQATGTGAAGAHFGDATDWFQTELAASAPHPVRLTPVDESLCVYDDHMELTAAALRRLVDGLPDTPLIVDLHGTRDLTGEDPDADIITIRPTARATRTWGAAMHPLVMNLAHDEPGEAISLARVADVDLSEAGERAALGRLRSHLQRGQEPSRRDVLRALAPKLDGLRDRLRSGS